MSAHDRAEFEYRRRIEAERSPDQDAHHDTDPAATDNPPPSQRIQNQSMWVELQIRAAMERGEFDDLPGAGKPLRGLGGTHDPNWWVKQLIEREHLSVLPPALALRRDDAELDDLLDRWARESDVRREVEEFNLRIIQARRQLQGGPPVITALRDVDVEVQRWSARRRERLRIARERADSQEPPRARWWSRRWFRR